MIAAIVVEEVSIIAALALIGDAVATNRYRAVAFAGVGVGVVAIVALLRAHNI